MPAGRGTAGRGTARPEVSHSQYWIQDDLLETDPSMYVGFNGLISAQGSVGIVLTGTSFGRIRLTAEGRLSPPAEVDLASWDDVVEVSLDFVNGSARILAGMGTIVPGLPLLSAAGQGPYRVRVHARGRDLAAASPHPAEPAAPEEPKEPEEPEEPVEEHLVIAWPAATGPEVRYKLSDAYGAVIRAG